MYFMMIVFFLAFVGFITIANLIGGWIAKITK